MGQTLTHGIYLPAEGERNCYAGLAANWQLLDGAVGTVAEHTTALAGKAPLVHTHTKADITDFPAYGTTAGTICEGNDSRLSDARTPVAHTHTKSDVTDLLNSNFIPSANNTYDLGSSSYQWNNLYAKGYYYNGVAWGLDKANEWTGTNTFASVVRQKINSVFSQTPDTDRFGVHEFIGTDNNRIFNINCADRSSGQRELSLMVYANDGTFKATGLYKGSDNSYSFRARYNNEVDLGTSTNKWKSFNGVNPGALSLPDYNNYLDVTSSIPVASLDGNTSIQLNDYLADKTGWLSIVIDDTAGNFIVATQGKAGGATVFNNSRTFHTGAQSNGFISVFFPIIAGLSKPVLIKASSLIQMRFYPCQGNV